MNNALQVFEFEAKQVRYVIGENGEPWFVGKDVCDILGIMDTSQAVGRLDEDEKGPCFVRTPGGIQEMLGINESGFHALVLRSNKPQAKPFRKWVTSEVLPSIKKFGMYMTYEVMEKTFTDPNFLVTLVNNYKKEYDGRIAAEEKLMLSETKVEQLEIKIKEDEPKINLADSIVGSVTSILFGNMAKILCQRGVDIGRDRFFAYCRENGYLGIRGKEYNIPTQYSIDLGIMEIRETTYTDSNGKTHIRRTPMITGKGQLYFINKFLKMNDGEEGE